MSLLIRLSTVAAIAVLLRCVSATVVITAPSTATGNTAGLETREQGPTAWICSALAVDSPWTSYANIRGYLEGGNAEKKDYSNLVLYPVMELFHANESRLCVYLPAEDHCYPPVPSTGQVTAVKQLSKRNYYAMRFWGQASDARVQYYKQKLTAALNTQSKAANYDLFFVSFFSDHVREVRYDPATTGQRKCDEPLQRQPLNCPPAPGKRASRTTRIEVAGQNYFHTTLPESRLNLSDVQTRDVGGSNIQTQGACASAASSGGHSAFSFVSGACKVYDFEKDFCPFESGDFGIYIITKPLGGSKGLVVSNITLAFSGNTIIKVTWDVTPNLCFVAYRVNYDYIHGIVSDKLATVTTSGAPPCAEYNLTVTPVDANSAAMGPAATVKVVIPKALELSLNLTHGVTAVKASWGSKYTCNPKEPPATGGPIASYLVKHGDETGNTKNSTFGFTFDRKNVLCTDTASTLTASRNVVTLKAFDGTGAQLGSVTATLMNTSIPGHRYLSGAKNCIYYQKLEETPGGLGFTYNQLREFCQKTMFSDLCYDQNTLINFIIDVTYFENLTPSVVVAPHYTGLKRNSSSGKWVWQRGSEQPVPDAQWDSGEPSTAGDCAELKTNMKLAAVSCDATNLATVCFDNIS